MTRKAKGNIRDRGGVTNTKANDGAITIDMLTARLGADTYDQRVEAVFSCIRDKAETIGQLPVKYYKKLSGDNKREEVTRDSRDKRIFTQNPNDYQTTQEFLEMMVASLERFGAFYAYREMNERGVLKSIIPFRYQNNVKPSMDLNGNIYYTYVRNDGTQGDAYDASQLFIIRGFTFDGFNPISPLAYNAGLIATTVAQEGSYRELQENGITSQMALATDGMFKDPNAAQRMKDDWDKFRGGKGVKNIPIFEQGLKPVSLKLTPQESDLLHQREFSVNRICRIFRVPVHRVGVAVNSTSSGTVFDLDEAYMRDALNPILVKFEHAMNAMVPAGYEISIDRNAFYSGSPWRIGEKVEKLVKGGLLSINQGRSKLGEPPEEGGDVFAVDNNNVVYATWKELPAIQEMIYNQSQTSQEPTEANDDSPE